MNNNKYWNLPSLIFNLIETFLLIGASLLLKLKIYQIMSIFLVFEISRFYFKFPKHYKAWQSCLIWTLIIFTSLFLVAKVDLFVGMTTIIFTAYILSGKADIKDIYMWNKGKPSKYKKLDDYIKYNGLNKELLELEDNLKTYNTELYLIYKRRFRENKSFEEIREEFDLDNPRINEIIDKAYTLITFNLRI